MNKITGVLVDGHIFDIKNDMTDDGHFPNSLFPGATFKMVIDNDPANNSKVVWMCASSDGQPLAVSEDGTVTFPGVDETCCGKAFYIFATDKTTGSSHSIYTFTVKRFFKYSEEVYRSVRDISPWIENMHGAFPEPIDIDSQAYDDPSMSWHTIKRSVNNGLYQEWGIMAHSGWSVNPDEFEGICSIYAFDKERKIYYLLEDSGGSQEQIAGGYRAQAVAFYGTSRV